MRVHGVEVLGLCQWRSVLAWERFIDFLRAGQLGQDGQDAAEQYQGR